MVQLNYHRVTFTWKRKARLHLHSATHVHWSGGYRNRAEKRRLQAILSVLPTFTNIRCLSLFTADINFAHQALICGLSTLRTLVMYCCRLHPSTKPLPLSHVTDLKLTTSDMQTIRRLLTSLATTIETLEVNYRGDLVGFTLQDGLIGLPKLSSFKIKTYHLDTNLATLNTFKQYKSITTICILLNYHHLDHHPSIVSFHHSDLPALRSVTCGHNLAASLIPQRPVTTYVEGHRLKEGRWKLFNSLSKTRAKITNLKISAPDHLHSLLPSLATFLPDLEQLTLKCFGDGVAWLGASSPNHLILYTPPGAAAANLPKLKWVTILLDYDQFKAPGMSPEWLRKTYFVPVCPALEVFECLCIPFYKVGRDFGLSSEPNRAWKTRRLPDGSWERLGPPPIPTPVPATELGAVA